MSQSSEPTFNLDAFIQLLFWLKQDSHRRAMLDTLAKEDPENHRRVKAEMERLRTLVRPEPDFDPEVFIADWLSSTTGIDKLGQLQFLQPTRYYAVLTHLRRVFEAALSATAKLNAGALADKFLQWPLPESVCADGCATVHGAIGRTGTNLLGFLEAKQMFEDVLSLKNPTVCDDPHTAVASRAREDVELAKLAAQVDSATSYTTGVDWGVEHVSPEVLVQALRACVGLDPEHAGAANTFEHLFQDPDAGAVVGELLEYLRALGIAPASREEMQASKLHACWVKWSWVSPVTVTHQQHENTMVERLRAHILRFTFQLCEQAEKQQTHTLMLKCVDQLRGIKVFSCAHMTDDELLDGMIRLHTWSKRLEANWQKRGISFNTTLALSRNPVPPLSDTPSDIATAVERELGKYADPDFGKVPPDKRPIVDTFGYRGADPAEASCESSPMQCVVDWCREARAEKVQQESVKPEVITVTPAVMIECVRALLFTKEAPRCPADPQLKEAALIITWQQYAELSCQFFLLDIPTDCIRFASPESFNPVAADKLYSVQLIWSAATVAATQPGRDCALWQRLREAVEHAAPIP